jgi:signal transduction histidine kinase
VRWLTSRGELVRDAQGRAARLLGALTDTTAQREADAALRASAARIARLQAVTAALSRVLTPADVAAVIAEQSQAALGATSSSVRLLDESGQWLALLTSAGALAEAQERRERLPLSAALPVAETVRTGRPFFIESCAAPLDACPDLAAPGQGALIVAPLLLEGQALGSLALTFDAPRRFDAEEQAFVLALAGQCAQALERARLYAAAQAALAARDSFITVASHDLRTPLTALLGQAILLERRAEQEGASERLRRSSLVVRQQAARLSRMIDALLDLSLIQSGQLLVERAPLDLAALLRRIVEEVAPTLTIHTLELQGGEEACPVEGDELRLEQVFLNLIGNAVKYSPEGGAVLVRLARHGAEVLAEVRDDGIGIPAEALPRLFERFYRAPNAGEHAVSGAGIGLYVVRELVARHGGRVEVASEVGAGSAFTVCLPLA